MTFTKFFLKLIKFSLLLYLIIFFLSYLISFFSNDAPYPWQIGFQDPASPGFNGISILHDNIFFYLVFISLAVFWVLLVVILLFKKNLISAKYFNHATFAEVV